MSSTFGVLLAVAAFLALVVLAWGTSASRDDQATRGFSVAGAFLAAILLIIVLVVLLLMCRPRGGFPGLTGFAAVTLGVVAALSLFLSLYILKDLEFQDPF